MGLDVTFVNPASFIGTNPEDPELSDYEGKTTLAGNITILRIIDWLPYTAEKHRTLRNPSAPCTNIRTNDRKTVGEFISWLIKLRDWVLDNRDKYIYLLEPKYDWQKPFYTNSNYILFGDIVTMNSPVKLSSKAHPNLFAINHHIYWTDKREPRHIDMIHDAMLIQTFIDELHAKEINDNWIVMFH